MVGSLIWQKVAQPALDLLKVQIGTPLIAQDNSVFKNWMYNASNFNATTFAYPANMNVDGYPTGIIPGDISVNVYFPREIVTTSTTLVFAWSGKATNGASTAIGVAASDGGNFNVTASVNATTATAPFTTSNFNAHGTDGYIEFNFANTIPTNLQIGFQSGSDFGSAGTQFRSLIFCLKSDYAAIVAASAPADLFSTAYINAWKALQPKTIRTMNESGANGGNITQQRYQNNWANSLNFQGSRFVPNCWAGGPGTAGPNITGTNAYACSAATDSPSGAYVMGEMIQGQFQHVMTRISSVTASNNGGNTRLTVASTTGYVNGAKVTATSALSGQTTTASYVMSGVTGTTIDIPLTYNAGRTFSLINPEQTININSRGAVPILDVGGTPMATSNLSANNLATLIYDDLLAGFLIWTTDSGGIAGLNTTWPVEVQVALANAVGCNLWYNIPPHFTYNSSSMEATSSIAQVAALISGSITNGCYFEFGNEVWNPSGGFYTTTWSLNCGAVLGFSSALDSFYGLCVARSMPIVRTAWGAKAGLKCVDAYQSGSGANAGSSNQLNRSNGAELKNATSVKYASYVNVDYSVASPTWSRPIDQCDTVSYATYYLGAQCQQVDQNYLDDFGNAGSATFLNVGGPVGGIQTGLLGAADAYATGGATNITNALAWLDWDVRQGMSATTKATVSGSPGAAIYTVASSLPNNSPIIIAGVTSVPGGLTAGTVYYIKSNTGSQFNISATPGGAALTISSNGSGQQLFGATAISTLAGFTTYFFAAQGWGLYNNFEQLATAYDGARPPGRSNLTIENYEGAFSCLAPTTATCTTIGISTAYGGVSGKIDVLLTAYKNSSLLQAVVKQQLDDFFNTPPFSLAIVNHSTAGSVYEFTGGDQWSLYPGNIYSGAWQSGAAIAAYHFP